MAHKPYVTIDAEILNSTVWGEPAHIRLVWLTLLILCDMDGYVGASIPGIARASGVTEAQAREAIKRFQEPDPDSRTKTDEGRRLKEVERGFLILNFKDHLDRMSGERAKSRDRVRRFRERRRMAQHETPVTPGNVTVPVGKRDKGQGTRDITDQPTIQASVGGGSLREEGRPANPLLMPGDRPKLESELLKLVRVEAHATKRDPIEVMAEVSRYEGARTSKLNPATMSDDRLLNSVLDARSRVKELEAKKARRGR
jgi:hypothetical protein